jgi:small subunit ribosomal protein S8
MWSDPIADMLTRIRNAISAGKKQVLIPASKVKKGIADVLKSEGYIDDYDMVDDGKQGHLRITLKFGPRGEKLIHSIQRESRPGRRLYVGVEEIPRVLDGLGVAVVSTSRGVMSDRQCREARTGGELLCTVY